MSEATSLCIYLEVESEDQVHGLADRIGDLLLECGYNAGDSLTAVIACRSDTEDVRAWAEGPEQFVAAMSGAAFILIPNESGREDA